MADTEINLAVTPREMKIILTGLMLALTLASLDQNIMSTALPRITGDFGGLAHISWVITSFVVTSTVSAPLYGRLSDLYGRKAAFTVSILLFLLGSVLCGASRSMLQLIVFRALQGLGAGGLMVLSQTVIGDLVAPRDRGRYQGLFAAVFTACSVAGPLIGGLISQYFSWRWIFYVNLPVGFASLALIIGWLKAKPLGPAPKLDLAGAGLLIVGTCSLLLVLSWGGTTYPWASAPVLGLAGLAVAAFALMVPVEQHAPQAILPPDLFSNRVFVIGSIATCFTAMALFAAVVFLPLMFQLLMSATPARAGLMIVPLMGGVIISSFVGGRFISRTGRYKILPVSGLFVVTVGFFTLAWATRHGTRVPPIEAVLFLMGLGLGLVMPTMTTAIQNGVARHEIGGATASVAFFRSLGSAFGVAFSGIILAASLQRLPLALQGAGNSVAQIGNLPAPQREIVLAAYRTGLSGAFAIGACIAALGFIAVLFLPELPLRSAQTA